MIELPDFDKSFFYETNFYLSCNSSRVGKFIAHYELFKKTIDVAGAIIECGVFKGASLARFAMLRQLFDRGLSKKIIAFDVFGAFPQTNFDADKELREKFIQAAGEESISVEQMTDVFRHKNCTENIELIKGDICETVPQYLRKNPQLKISLLNLDTDIYEPCVAILQTLWPCINKGGILLLDDYGVFPGETKGVDEYFRDKNVRQGCLCLDKQ